MKNLIISETIQQKLIQKHAVYRREVEQCILNIDGPMLEEAREDHRTDPPTRWFLSSTNAGRLLKVVFVLRDGKIFIRTCYSPNADEIRIYNDAR